MAEHKVIQLTDDDMKAIKGLSACGPQIPYDKVVGLRKGTWNKAVEYEDWRDKLDALVASNPPSVQKVNRELAALNTYRAKDVQPGAVHQNAALSQMSLQYANEAYIGEQLAPVVTSSKLSDLFYIYPQRERLEYPDDELGPRGDANEINETRDTDTFTCVGYGYKNYLDADTLSNQDAPLDEMMDLTESIAEGLAFRREQRHATLLTTAGNYGTNTGAIAAGDRWDTTVGGDPIGDLQTAMAGIWTGRAPSQLIGFTSLDVYNVLSRHPQILDLFKYNGSSPGLATPEMIARFLGMDGLLVGKARQQTAAEAATAVYTRIWGDVFGIVRVARRPTKRMGAFATTFRHKDVSSISWFDQEKGVHGGYFAKTAVSEVSQVIAVDTGWLITTPIN